MRREKAFLTHGPLVPVVAYKALGHQTLHSSQQPAGEKGGSLLREVGGAGKAICPPECFGFVPPSCP